MRNPADPSVSQWPNDREKSRASSVMAEYLEQFVVPMFDAPYLWKGTGRAMIAYRSSFTACFGELLRLMPAETVGRTLYRVGYEAGERCAEFVLERTSATELVELISQCLAYSDLCGFTSFELNEVNVDVAQSRFHCVIGMTSSIEADGYLQNPPPCHRKVCMMQAGYLSGAISRLTGLPIRFEETACRGELAERCQLVGAMDCPEDGRPLPLSCHGATSTSGLSTPGLVPAPHSGAHVWPNNNLVGNSSALQSLWARLRRIAPSRTSILIQGETGVGKELIARNVHALSDRAKKPFVAVNCAALPESLIDAELFGVERGAFTGAVRSRSGKFEQAHTGTLFLDEIGLLSPTAQGKLLRVLEDGTFDRVGGRTEQVDVRLVAATNVDLGAAVERGEFRIDLYYRICAITLYVPPLRERKEDILPIAYFVLHSLMRDLGGHWKGFSRQVEERLLLHNYPGNVRELKQIVTAAASFTDNGETIDMSALSAAGIDLANTAPRRDLNRPAGGDLADIAKTILAGGMDIKELERQCIRHALEANHGNLSRAARALGLTRRQLEYRVKGV